MATTAADTMDEKVAWVRQAAGDRLDDLEFQLQVFVTVVTDDPQSVAEKLSGAFGLPPEVILAAPFYQVGTVEQITEDIQAIRERWGINYILFQNDGLVPMGPVVAKLSGT